MLENARRPGLLQQELYGKRHQEKKPEDRRWSRVYTRGKRK